jgi:hypothetical protein
MAACFAEALPVMWLSAILMLARDTFKPSSRSFATACLTTFWRLCVILFIPQ